MIQKIRSLIRRIHLGVDYLEVSAARLQNIDQHLFEINAAQTSMNERIQKIEERGAELSIHGSQIADNLAGKSRTSVASESPTLSFDDYSYEPKVRKWSESRAGRKMLSILQKGDVNYANLLEGIIAYAPFFEAIPVTEPENNTVPYWENGWFPALDAASLYGLISIEKPARYIEIGSGNSTKFARRAISDQGLSTKIVSIDPFPRAEIDALCDEVIRHRCEDVDVAFYENIAAGDILFVDNSHRAFQNSDVTVFFTEILPSLPKGVIVGIHDIFLPEDYPNTWLGRYYNEQYLLASYIFAGMAGGDIVLPNAYIQKSEHHMSRVRPVFNSSALSGVGVRGGAFWLRT
jgi:hypothetical protein